MAYTITSQCIQCDRCLSSCPTNAIQKADGQYWINTTQCDSCQSAYSVPQCWATCPTNDGCVYLAEEAIAIAHAHAGPSSDYWESWFITYSALTERLKRTQTSAYWRSWFDTYATRLSQLQLNAL